MVSKKTPYSYIQYVYLFTQGRGEGGELNQRERGGQQGRVQITKIPT
jgi:hypothetical protein